MRKKPPIDVLLHYGIKRKSGRYPWGSGEDPYQNEGFRIFLRDYESLKARGLKPTEIAEKLGMNTTQLRNSITWARAEENNFNREQARVLKDQGMTNVAIGKALGVSEASVRNYLSAKSPGETSRKVQLENIEKAIKSGVDRTGYLDVGVGVERQIGISRTKFNAVVNKLIEEEGYHVHEVFVKRLSEPSGNKYTTVKVLTKNPDVTDTRKNSDKVRPLDSWSDDNAQTLNTLDRPRFIDLDRVHVRYAEDGGADRDGLIELRPGVEDLDLGGSKYAQVRIAAKGDLYLKGMAAYSDNIPDGVDIIFNTNKSRGTPVESVLKKMDTPSTETDDPSAMFGSSVKRQKGALNIVNEEGEWNTWSTTMSSQFLSKQPASLIKDRLDATKQALTREFEELNSLTNPVVKKYLMESYIDGLDAKAKHLKAQGLPRTKNHVILPVPDIKPNEIYAPRYKDGERVVLVRHPHGGIFEIPELVVNNKHNPAKKMIGNAPDAVGIHPSVAEKLSGADFDGDTVLVIPNNNRQVKTSRTLKELKNWGDEMHVLYKRDYQTIKDKTKQLEMGKISNLITDMTIQGASESEIARAVKHSMVVIDSEKHRLDYKQSAIDNGIKSLVDKYQKHVNPDTGKVTRGASTLISRSKRKIDISQHEQAIELSKDRVSKDGRILKKGLTTPEIAKQLKVPENVVEGYLRGEVFDPGRYSSRTVQDELYVDYIRDVQSIKNTATKTYQSIPKHKYSREAAKVYSEELKSLNAKLNTALLNAPRERQAQILTNKLFYSNVKPGMSEEDRDKLKSRSLAKARNTVGAKRSEIKVTDREWEAIQAGAVSETKLKDILNNANMDIIRQHATPKAVKLSSSRATRARDLLNKGYTYAQVADQLGVPTSALIEELS